MVPALHEPGAARVVKLKTGDAAAPPEGFSKPFRRKMSPATGSEGKLVVIGHHGFDEAGVRHALEGIKLASVG